MESNDMELNDYINIIIDSINLLNLNIPNYIINNFKIKKKNLKFNILEFEQYLFSNQLVSHTITSHWKLNKFIWDYEYLKLENDDYYNIFRFFLIILHNIPYFQPYSDNVIPGCNILYNKVSNYNIYYEHKLKTNSSASYMRILDWKRNFVTTSFNCYCENFDLKNIYCEKIIKNK